MYQVKRVEKGEIMLLIPIQPGMQLAHTAKRRGYAIIDDSGKWVKGELYHLKEAAVKQAAWMNAQ